MRIPLMDLGAMQAPIMERMKAAACRVLESGRYIMGPEVEAFESELAEALGVKYAVAVSSGSDALVVALRACGLSEGDLVVTSPFTFIATAEAILRIGAIPRFVDVDPWNMTIDEDAAASVGQGSDAVIPVHLFGRPSRVVHDCVIEDAAQAFGVPLRGRVGCLSFFPAKAVGCCGDGGACYTDDPILADAMRRIRQHGHMGGYVHAEIGGNFRLDAIQAAILRIKLELAEEWLDHRRANASIYCENLPDAVKVQSYHPDHVWSVFTVRLPGARVGLQSVLEAAGIGSAVYYPIPLHRQAPFDHLGLRWGDMPNAEILAETVISLPIWPGLTRDQILEICGRIGDFYA